MADLAHCVARSRAAAALLAVAGVLVTSCSAESPTASSVAPPPASPGAAAASSPAAAISDIALADEYRSGLTAELRVPGSAGPAPLIVVVPGGGWWTAEPDYLVPFSQSLTAAGSTTSLITYSGTRNGARFPQPADDVACAVRWSVRNAADLGYPPSRVVVAGHSAGAHLAALVALSGDEFGGECEWPPVTIDGVIGMSGAYDSHLPVDNLDLLFEGNDTAKSRAMGSPLEWADSAAADRPGFRVLLLHGEADDVFSVGESEALADALQSAGVEVDLIVLPDQGHEIPTKSNRVLPEISAWLATKP